MPHRREKVVLVGDSGAGKTTLLSALAGDRVSVAAVPTIGVAYRELRVRDTSLEVWDTAGQERYASLVPMYVRGATCAWVVLPVGSSSLQRRRWHRVLRERAPSCVIIDVLSKADLLVGDLRVEGDVVLTSAFMGLGTGELIDRTLASLPAQPSDGDDRRVFDDGVAPGCCD